MRRAKAKQRCRSPLEVKAALLVRRDDLLRQIKIMRNSLAIVEEKLARLEDVNEKDFYE